MPIRRNSTFPFIVIPGTEPDKQRTPRSVAFAYARNIVDYLRSMVLRRWRTDVGKFYLILALALLFGVVRDLVYTFEAPPRYTLAQVTGTLTVQPAKRGFFLHVDSDDGRRHTFTCNTGYDVFCPKPKSLPRGKAHVTAHYAKQRPELLLHLESETAVLLDYDWLSSLYRFKGLKLWFLYASLVFLSLFFLSPKLHKGKPWAT